MKKLILIFWVTIIHQTTYAQFRDFSEYIYFETPDSLLKIDTSLTGNIWQIGTPSKTFFNSSISLPNAIVTDTLNFYPPNNISSFTIKISDPAWGVDRTYINFTHKFDTDSLQDGGYIEISYDGGSTWTNIANDQYLSDFYYDWPNNPVIANGNSAYTGRSGGNLNGWRQDGFGWCYFNVISPNPDSVFLRFVFSSDSIQTNKEGWMIDNVVVFSDICEGISENQNDKLISISPNPVSNQLFIHDKTNSNKRLILISNFTGQLFYTNKYYDGIPIDVRNFPNGMYFLKYSDSKFFSIQRFIIQH